MKLHSYLNGAEFSKALPQIPDLGGKSCSQAVFCIRLYNSSSRRSAAVGRGLRGDFKVLLFIVCSGLPFLCVWFGFIGVLFGFAGLVLIDCKVQLLHRLAAIIVGTLCPAPDRNAAGGWTSWFLNGFGVKKNMCRSLSSMDTATWMLLSQLHSAQCIPWACLFLFAQESPQHSLRTVLQVVTSQRKS